MTVGEMMARRLQGDDSISMDDINKATVNFFESKGVSCTINTENENSDEKADNS